MVPSLRWLPRVSTACSSAMKSPHDVSCLHAPHSTSSWPRTCAHMPAHISNNPSSALPQRLAEHAAALHWCRWLNKHPSSLFFASDKLRRSARECLLLLNAG